MPVSGPPPPEYQCQAKRKNGRQCRKWALKSRRYCEFHGGRSSRKAATRVDHLPRFYSHKLTDTLTERIESYLQLDPSEQVTLLQELALMREAASEAVGLYAAAQTTNKEELKASAAELMVQALKNVKEMCQAAAQVEASRNDKLDGFALKTVIHQIVRIAYECFEDDPRAKLFEKMIREKIRVPGDVQAAEISPQEQVEMMMKVTVGK